MARFYISITGLQLKSFYVYPLFMYHAIPSLMQAKSAPGIIHADTYYIEGIHHTLTIWEDRASMLQYLRQGAHLQAMKISRKVGDYGKIYGFESEDILTDWNELRKLWNENGRVFIGEPRKDDLVGPHWSFSKEKNEQLQPKD